MFVDYDPQKPLVSYVGDICQKGHVSEAFMGCDVVIHSASLVSYGTHPDVQAMQQVNVTGEVK